MRTLAATAALTTLLLAGCGSDDGEGASERAADSASASSSESASESASPSPSESGSSGASATPDWAPQIITDDQDSVTGLDFAGVGEPSPELLVEQVRTGDGPAVEAGQTITADYFGQLAEETEPFDESFSSEPFQAPIGVGRLIAGWDEGLVGVPVGSRVIMSIPPDLGYGETGSGSIPGGATLYFVVDVIDAQ